MHGQPLLVIILTEAAEFEKKILEETISGLTGQRWGDEHFSHSIVSEVSDRCLDSVWAFLS